MKTPRFLFLPLLIAVLLPSSLLAAKDRLNVLFLIADDLRPTSAATARSTSSRRTSTGLLRADCCSSARIASRQFAIRRGPACSAAAGRTRRA